MRTYTEHKLTDAQLRRLSAIANKTKGAAKHGVAGQALRRKGLTEEFHDAAFGATDIFVTEAGIAALAKARGEGW